MAITPSQQDENRGGIYPLLGILTIVLFPVYMGLGARFPLIRLLLPPGMIILGIVLIIVSFVSFRRYGRILDYEPMQLWGRETNGKKARSLFMQTGVSGGWLLIMGVVIKLF